MSSYVASDSAAPAPDHSWEFRVRRTWNWFSLGLMYATFYMGRYNLSKAKPILANPKHWDWDKATSGFWLGSIPFWTYGLAVLLNGPLADRFGGKRAILFGGIGTVICNLVLGLLCGSLDHANKNAIVFFSVAIALNYYFQTFGALSVVKVNTHWFHVRERGTFGGIFGCMIQSGYILALGVGGVICDNLDVSYVFYIPAVIIALVWVLNYLVVRESPGQAGLQDFDTGDATEKDDGKPVSLPEIARKIFTNRVLITIALAQICVGFARQGILFYYTDYLIDVHKIERGVGASYLADWISIPVGGMIGGIIAGRVSDRFFGSRRPPVALLAFLLLAAAFLGFALFLPSVVQGVVGKEALKALAATDERVKMAWVAAIAFGLFNFCINAGHGILSGTAAMDFGGKKAAATAAGMLDGFSYLGAGIAMWQVGKVIEEHGYEKWPLPLMGAALVAAALMTTIWKVVPRKKTAVPAETARSLDVMGHPEGVSKGPRRGSRETQGKILEQVLALAKEAGPSGVVVFDLDSTLLDNRPRQATLLREWAERRGVQAVARTRPEHLDGWDLRVAMVNAGLPRAEAEAVYPDAKQFWRERFFTSDYCKLDVPVAGAVAYVEKLRATGVQIAYVTGRHEGMRAGTVESFSRAGFPVPDDKTVRLLMKPTFEQDDDAWKVEAKALLRPLGKVLAAFDNEPIHVNGYKEAFPETVAVHLDTDSSGRPVAVLASIPSILDFS